MCGRCNGAPRGDLRGDCTEFIEHPQAHHRDVERPFALRPDRRFRVNTACTSCCNGRHDACLRREVAARKKFSDWPHNGDLDTRCEGQERDRGHFAASAGNPRPQPRRQRCCRTRDASHHAHGVCRTAAAHVTTCWMLTRATRAQAPRRRWDGAGRPRARRGRRSETACRAKAGTASRPQWNILGSVGCGTGSRKATATRQASDAHCAACR